MEILLLGTGGLAATGARATACTLVRADDRALLLDLGTDAGRLVADTSPLAGLSELEIMLAHFHLDHITGPTYLTAMPLATTIWAPGAWRYRADSASLLRPLRVPPVSPTLTSAPGARSASCANVARRSPASRRGRSRSLATGRRRPASASRTPRRS